MMNNSPPTKTNISIHHLNCKGLVSKLQEIKTYVNNSEPDIVCLSETWLTKNEPKLKNYQSFWKNRQRIGGGLGIFIVNSITARHFNLIAYNNGLLEFLGIEIFTYRYNWIKILCLYNPCKNVTYSEMMHYINQLGNSYVIMGDMNAHSPILDGKYYIRSNSSGIMLEKLIFQENVILLNEPNVPTYIDYRTGKPSCLDICLVSSNLAQNSTFSVGPDLGSDHRMIITSIRPTAARTIIICPKRWKLKSVNWKQWRNRFANEVDSIVMPCDAEALNDSLINRVNSASDGLIPLTSGKTKIKQRTAWWDKECQDRVKARRKARHLCEKHPTEENIRILRKLTAEAKYHIKKKKKESWNRYVHSLSPDTPITKVWEKINKIKGTYSQQTLPIAVNGDPIINPILIANTLAVHFAGATAGRNLELPQDYQMLMEKSREKPISAEFYEYDEAISEAELGVVLNSGRNTSPGADGIPNIFIRNLPQCQKDKLLYMYNTSWYSGHVPSDWKHGIIIPIHKPNKLKTEASSYRPITLLSCIGKYMEKILCNRLIHWLERNKILSDHQCGFRKGLSTYDVLHRLEQNIKNSLFHHSHTVVVYLDLQGAFDKVWHPGLLYKLAKIGISGRMFRWIEDYLLNRTFQVRVGNSLSDIHPVNAGVPQGAVLSPTLFNLMLHDLPEKQGINIYTYADDITISCSGQNLEKLRIDIQCYLTDLITWLHLWGMVVSVSKSSMQVFSRSRRPEIILRINNEVLPCSKTQKILGITLDAPLLTFKHHIELLCIDVRRRIDIMKCLSSTNWGASQKILRMFYISYVRGKLDYGSSLYGTAAATHLKKLDSLQNTALRLVSGCRRSTPVISLEVVCHVPSLELRRFYLRCKFYIKLLGRDNEEETKKVLCISNNDRVSLYPQSFIKNVKSNMRSLHMEPIIDINRYLHSLPPWQNLNEYTRLSLDIDTNSNWRDNFIELIHSRYLNFYKLYTDGSQISEPIPSTACALFDSELSKTIVWKISCDHSVLSSELFALSKALQYIQIIPNSNNFVIFTDSKSAVQLIGSTGGSYAGLVGEIRQLLYSLNQSRLVVIEWVKGHSGIQGNEIVDRAASLAHSNSVCEELKLEAEEILTKLKRGLYKEWNDNWKFNVETTAKGKFLYNLYDKSQHYPQYKGKSRRLCIVLNRLRTGHAGVDHYLHRFNMSDTPLCCICGIPDTIEHLLLHCVRYDCERQIMLSKLHEKGIAPITVSVLLGSSNSVSERYCIVNALTKFLEHTKTFSFL